MFNQPDYSKIIVAHPGRQHSFRIAEALERHGLLYKYITTVYDSSNSIWMKLIKFFLKGNNYERANNRKMNCIDDSKVIQFCELYGLIVLLIYRLNNGRRIARWFNKLVSISFQKKLLKYIIKNNIGVVISYDANSEVLFDILKLKAPNVIRIMDNAAPNRHYLHDIYSKYNRSAGEFLITYKKYDYLFNNEVALKYKREIIKANLHIVASSFSKNALIYDGIDPQNIIIAQYGINLSLFKNINNKSFNKIKILYVGEINQRKGIQEILNTAIELKNDHYIIEFHLVGGGVDNYPEIFKKFKNYVIFHGSLYFEKLLNIYNECNIFVFPSLGDGYGLVILEALAAGLPVIASRNCGGPDIIQDGYNGFLIDAGSTKQLKEKILWCYNHKEELPRMSGNAMQSVSNMSWEHYGDNLVNQLKDKIDILTQQSK